MLSRRKFLKALGGAAAAAVIPPSSPLAFLEASEEKKADSGSPPVISNVHRLSYWPFPNLIQVKFSDVEVGDLFLIDDELVRVEEIALRGVRIQRGFAGTDIESHGLGCEIRRLNPVYVDANRFFRVAIGE
jgi:hypothetical protein